MATQRAARLVCNPGLACVALVESNDLGVLPVANVSSSGIALTTAQPAAYGESAFDLAIFHRARPASGFFGAEQPLRVRAKLSRYDRAANRLCLSFETGLNEESMRALRASDHAAFASERERWNSDSFLDQLARAGDFPSDSLDERLTLGVLRQMNRALAHADDNSGALPVDTPPQLRAFLESTAALPSWVDLERMNRGRDVLLRHAIPIGVVLFLKVLPTGYCASALSRALAVSGDLERRPVRRSLLVLNMILDLAGEHAFSETRGTAVPAAQRLRLLHSGVRRIVHTTDGAYSKDFGVPVNQEHMLATIMGFSYETVKGLRQFHLGLSRAQEEDFYYLWQVFGWMLGLHPEGQLESRRHMPQSFAEAEAFQAAYRRRHFRSAAENPNGVSLTRALLRDVSERVSAGLPLPLVRRMPYWLCAHFLSAEDQLRLDIPEPRHPRIARISIAGFVAALAALRWLLDQFETGRRAKHGFTMKLLSGLVHGEFGGEPRVRIPEDLHALRTLMDRDDPSEAGPSSDDDRAQA